MIDRVMKVKAYIKERKGISISVTLVLLDIQIKASGDIKL
jgi:hypothetical protein